MESEDNSEEMHPEQSACQRKSQADFSEVIIHGNEADDRTASYEEAFNKAGFGLWQYVLLLQCGWANASDAIEIMCISFIIPSLRDSMDVSHAALSGLTFVLFLGMMAGGYFWGSLADTYGRRRTVCFSLTVNAVFGCLSALCTQYWLLLLFRFLSGFGAGGSLPACFTYFSEFQPNRCRGAMISALAMCWMIGNLIVGLLAYGLLPESATIQKFSPFGDQWRLFTIVCAIPSLSSGILFFFMPESPKYLYTTERRNECLKVLKLVHSWNRTCSRSIPSFNIDYLHSSGGVEQLTTDEENENLLGHTGGERFFPHQMRYHHSNRVKTFCNTLGRNFTTWKSQMSQVFAPVRRSHSVTICIASMFIAFGGYGMSMWTPVLMEKTEKFGGSPCRGHTGNESLALGTQDSSKEVYLDVLYGFIAQLPGNLITILIMDKTGAKYMLIASLYLSGASVLFFWLADSRKSVIIINAIFSGINVGVWNSLDVILVEMYPTNIRSVANGNSAGMNRVGAMLGTALFGLFMDLDCSVPILIVCAAFAFCGTISFRLPNTRHVTL